MRPSCLYLDPLEAKEKRGRLSSLETRLLADAREAARLIVLDMGRAFGKRGWFWTRYLLNKHGNGYRWANTLEYDAAGIYWVGRDLIWLHWGLDASHAASVARHELVHRLCYTDRYAELNGPHMAFYDWRQFQECIAETVQRAFHSAAALRALLIQQEASCKD